MSKALVEQFCRAQQLQDSFIFRCQREFKAIPAVYDEVDALRLENANLKAQLATLTAKAKSKEVA